MFYIALILSIIGLWVVFHGLSHCRRHPIKGLFRCTCGLVPLLSGLLVGVVLLNLQTYARLTDELPVAQLSFVEISHQAYQAQLQYPDGRAEHYVLFGDDWRMEAQFLKWKGWATVLGLEPQFRLERLAGRYQAIEQERQAERSVIDLYDGQGLPPVLDLWKFANQRPQLLPMVDASYGTATYLPMRDGTTYQVTVTNSGLIARELETN